MVAEQQAVDPTKDMEVRLPCGCLVVFVARSGFRTSHMMACRRHDGGPDQTGERNRIATEARSIRDQRLLDGPRSPSPPCSSAMVMGDAGGCGVPRGRSPGG